MDDAARQNEPALSDLQRLRSLELELVKTRNEAKVARLEARAAELELLIRQFLPPSTSETTPPSTESQSAELRAIHQAETQVPPAPKSPQPSSETAAEPILTRQTLAKVLSAMAEQYTPSAKTAVAPSAPSPFTPTELTGEAPSLSPSPRFDSWDSIRTATSEKTKSHDRRAPAESRADRDENHGRSATTPSEIHVRQDSPQPIRRPRMAALGIATDPVNDPDVDIQPDKLETNDEPKPVDSKPVVSKPVAARPTTLSFDFATRSDSASSDHTKHGPKPIADSESLSVDLEESSDEPRKKPRPAAWMASLIAHIGILLLAAAFTLSNPAPKDQVALTASATEPDEPVMETFAIETEEIQPEVSEPTPSETQYEISEVGQMAITEFKPSEIVGPPAPPMQSMLASSSASAAAMSMKSDSESTMQFCGVEGGGNHFVYLVDSSSSMGSAFESARSELLHSISQLKPDQRFYVVFFDIEPDYMRLTNASEDETRSLKASPENKQALERWAMTIKKDRGRAPYDPLKFAIELRPDVIFLLSDGEFPQGIEDLLQEINRQDNLFGDDGPISIVHTIGYHSREGESRMKRIAKQNGGQYRHIAKP
ncbi:vWA domain-containing protein [Stieleria varia]|uniref:VWFA domain-containing protein n=1 Tax=Stieleria varia TaxID=2528005 RepID=A0A5C5ZQU5_9BACT|nr:hypothetical protein [Stieleria varia]TWT89445.1 hypothetical protein Pla52n_67840 [Stieleria varia]